MIKTRPKHLALHKIKLPLPGLVSILHRASSLLLFLFLRLILWLFQSSLRSIETYTSMMELVRHPLGKMVSLVIFWAMYHHLLAGLRFLALDLHWGTQLATARASSKWVLGVSLALTVITGVCLW